MLGGGGIVDDHCHMHHWYEWLKWGIPIVVGALTALAVALRLKKRKS